MTHAILVCEPEPYWTPELQRRFLGTQITVRGCRKWSELEELSRSYEEAVRVVDFSPVASACLAGMAAASTSRARQALLLLVSAEAEELEWALRDGGAEAVFPDRISAEELARFCRRWLES